MGAGGRKLKSHRRRQRWAYMSYKKSHPSNEWKKPFAGSSHAKGIVLEKMLVILPSLVFHLIFEFEYDILLDISTVVLRPSKQPNSAIRKCEGVQLIKNGKDCSLCSQ